MYIIDVQTEVQSKYVLNMGISSLVIKYKDMLNWFGGNHAQLKQWLNPRFSNQKHIYSDLQYKSAVQRQKWQIRIESRKLKAESQKPKINKNPKYKTNHNKLLKSFWKLLV